MEDKSESSGDVLKADISSDDEKYTENIMAEGRKYELPEKQPCDIKKDEVFETFYDVLKELGRGSFGVVKECIDKKTGTHFAAKFIRKTTKTKTDAVREIETMNKLRHEKLVQIENAFETRREMIIVMEFIPGIELFEKIALEDTPNLTEKQVIKYLKQILHGVNYMHKKNLVHLDLKPENILCLTTEISNEDEQIKLIDFGLAREVKRGSSVSVMCGTPEFVAPEVISFEPISTASDMWSIGVITYVLLSGISPFLGDDDNETFQNVTLGEYDFEDEDDVFESVSENAKKFIEDLLHIKPKDRLTAEQCLLHDWLKEGGNDKTIDKKYIRQFLAKRKWKKTITAIKAVGRFKQSSHSYLLRKTRSRLNHVNFDKPKSVFDVASILKEKSSDHSKAAVTEKPKNVFDVCSMLKAKPSKQNGIIEKKEPFKPKNMLQVCNLLKETSALNQNENIQNGSVLSSGIENETVIPNREKNKNNDVINNTDNKESKIVDFDKKKHSAPFNVNGVLDSGVGGENSVAKQNLDGSHASNGFIETSVDNSTSQNAAEKPNQPENVQNGRSEKGNKKVYDFAEMSKFIKEDSISENELKERAMRRKVSRDRKKTADEKLESESFGIIEEESLKMKPKVESQICDSKLSYENSDETGKIPNGHVPENYTNKDQVEVNKKPSETPRGQDFNNKVSEKPRGLNNKGNNTKDIITNGNHFQGNDQNNNHIGKVQNHAQNDGKDEHQFITVDDPQTEMKKVNGSAMESNFQRARPRNFSERVVDFQKSKEMEDINGRKNRSHSVDIERLSLRKTNISGANAFLNNSQTRRQSSAIPGYNKDKLNSRANFKDRLAAFQKGCI